MDVRMKSELLIPGVQHAERKPISCTEVFWITCDLQKAFPHWVRNRRIVDELFILQGEWRQLARQREDHMDVAQLPQLRE